MKLRVVIVLGAMAVLGACDASAPPVGPSTATTTSGNGSSAVSTSPSPRPTDSATLFDNARTALTEAGGFHVAGTVSRYRVDVTNGPNNTTPSGTAPDRQPAATGTITAAAGGVLEVRQLADGTRYARGDAAWFDDFASGPDLSVLAGRWVVVPPRDVPTALLLSDLVNGQYAIQVMLATVRLDKYEVQGDLSGPEPFGGSQAYVIRTYAYTFAFAANGLPLPIMFQTSSGDDPQQLRFDGYGAPFQVEAPDPAEVVAIPPAS